VLHAADRRRRRAQRRRCARAAARGRRQGRGQFSAAVARPELVADIADRFGSQCVVASSTRGVSAPGRWEIFTHGGRKTGIDAVEHAIRLVARRGRAARHLDGPRRHADGYDLALTRAIADAVACR
jgi:cyclase